MRSALQEVAIILQAAAAKKPKYAREIFCQIYILDTTTTNLILQNVYITNALVNLQSLSYTIYQMDLLLEHQNSKFKCFQANWGSFLQESNDMFKLYALLVDALSKVRRAINKVIIRQKRSARHLTKDTLFDIQSLAFQLYCSQSITLEGSEPSKIYFLVHLALDLLKNGIDQLHISMWALNKLF